MPFSFRPTPKKPKTLDIFADTKKPSKYEKIVHLSTNQLIAVIADEDTCAGFVLSGIGEVRNGEMNFFVVDENTSFDDLKQTLTRYLHRPDIAIILINEHIAKIIWFLIAAHRKKTPVIIEIPDRYQTMDFTKDFAIRDITVTLTDTEAIKRAETARKSPGRASAYLSALEQSRGKRSSR